MKPYQYFFHAEAKDHYGNLIGAINRTLEYQEQPTAAQVLADAEAKLLNEEGRQGYRVLTISRL